MGIRSNPRHSGIEFLESRLLFTALLDNTFGTGGVSIQSIVGVPAGDVIDGGTATVTPDGGAIVVLGVGPDNSNSSNSNNDSPGQILLNRFTPSGQIDTTFGTGGFLLLGAPGTTVGIDGGGVFALPDGKFILEFSTIDNTLTDPVPTGVITAIRFNSNGIPDPTYGNSGVFVFPGGDGDDSSIDSAGRVLVPGSFFVNNFNEVDGVLRIDANGQLDSGFGQNGIAMIPEPDTTSNEGVRTAVAAGDDSVYVIGDERMQNPTGSDTAKYYVAHLTAGGSVDPGFNGGNFVELPNNYTDTDPPPAVVQSDGKLVLLASVDDNQGLVRINTDGSIDNTFDYTPLTSFDPSGQSAKLALEADGKIIIAGSSQQNGKDNFAVARLNTDGSADTSFGNGFAEPGVYGTTQASHASFVAAYPDGRIIAAGGVRNSSGGGNSTTAYIVRFEGSLVPTPIVQGPSLKVGGLDTTFGGANGAGAGVAKVTLQNFTATTAGIVTQSDGKLVVAATITPSGGGNSDFEVFRLNADGSTDTTFGVNGFARANFPVSATATSVQLLADGRILVVGSADNGAGGTDIAIARFNSDGSLDTSLQGTGRLQLSLRGTPGADVARALLINPDGSFYIAGSSNGDIALAKLNSDGSLAASFHGGVAFLDLGGNDIANAIVLQKDGKIIVAGSTDAGGAKRFAVARFTASGAVDATFGAVGKSHPGFVTIAIGRSDDEAFAAAIQPDGSILLGGFSATGSVLAGGITTKFALVRLNSAGKLDTKFGKAGKVLTSFAGQTLASITDLSVQAISKTDIRILASGKAATALGQPRSIALARYTITGALDTSFGTRGTSILLQGGNVSQISAFVAFPADSLSDQFTAFTSDAQGAVARTPSGGIRALASDNNSNSTSLFVAAIVADGVDFTGGLVIAKPNSVMGGAKSSGTLKVTNSGSIGASGSMVVTLYTSLDQSFTTDDESFSTVKLPAAIAAGQSKSFKFNFTYPINVSDGKYYILAELNSGPHPISEINFNNNAAISAPVKITAPFVDLSGSFQSVPKKIKFGAATSIPITVVNHGTATATGQVNVTLYGSKTRSFSSNDPQLFSTTLSTGIKPNASKTLKLNFKLLSGAVAPGSGFLIAVLNYLGTPADKVAKNNDFFSNSMVTVS
jgi:uncharacterized delta-60 repeat protein